VIYGKMFDGDDNEVAMTLQAHIYWDFGVVRLYAIAGRRPRPEDPGRNLHSLPGRRHWREGTFDHRSLQWAHDLVAAQFRYLFEDTLRPLHPGEDRRHQELRIAALWGAFLETEVTELAADPDYLAAHYDAVEFDGTPVGSAAQERLVRFLLRRYGAVRRYWVQQHPEWPSGLA